MSNSTLARFRRDDRRIKFVRDPLAGYFILTDAPGEQRVEYFPSKYYDWHCELYQAHGYQKLSLCPSCKGTGVEWYQRNGDADRDVCSVCHGEGSIDDVEQA